MCYFCQNEPLRQNDSMMLPGLYESLAKDTYTAILLLVFLYTHKIQGKTEFITYFTDHLKLYTNVVFSFMFILTSARWVLTDFCRFPLAKTEYGMF